MATGATTNYFLPYPLSTDPVRVAGDIEQLATRIDNILNEEIEDSAALMWTGGTFSNGLNTPTYNDSTGKMSMSLAQDIRTTASPQFVGLTLTGDIDVQGGDVTTNQTTFNLINSTTTTLNIGGAATTINIGNTSGQTNFAGDLNIATGKSYEINNIAVLSSTALGSSVVSSSLTSVGTITTGTWSANTIAVDKGGTGITSYFVGDLIYASGLTTLSRLVAVATGNVLISGGTETAPSWGKVGLDTHVSGTLGVANGGTGITSFGTGIATWLQTPSSANLAAAITDETGTGALVFAESPTFTGTVSVATIVASTINSTGADITLLSGVTGSPLSSASIIVNRGTSDDVSIRWNESLSSWQYTNDGTNYLDIGSGSGGGAALQDVLLLAGM